MRKTFKWYIVVVDVSFTYGFAVSVPVVPSPEFEYLVHPHLNAAAVFQRMRSV